MARIAIVRGSPYSGKTTQSRRLAKEGFYGQEVRHISIVDLHPETASSSYFEHGLAGNMYDSLSMPSHDDINDSLCEAIEGEPEDKIIVLEKIPLDAPAVHDLLLSLQSNNHQLLGAIRFSISLATMLERAKRITPTEDYTLTFEGFMTNEYHREFNIDRLAVSAISSRAPTEFIDAGGREKKVYKRFKKALGKLILQNHNI